MLEKTKRYLSRWYPYTNGDEYQEVVEELNQAIADSSLSAVTKELRQDGMCPRIVLMQDTQQYTFHKCAKKVFLDFEMTYVSNEGYRHGFNGCFRTGLLVAGEYVMVSGDHPKYPDTAETGWYYLYEWILYGGICEDCGATFLDMDAMGLCNTCGRSYRVLEYSAKAEELLVIEDTKETLFGIELEYENITAKQVGAALRGHAISKRDGSIRDGVEVVTRPACVKTHKQSLEKFYKDVKVVAKDNTGMHVHVDKKNLSAYEISFMIEFINKTALIPHIEAVAGRKYSTNHFCKATPDRKMSWGLEFNEGTQRVYKTATSKYSPINTSKEHTIEMRIFSSPQSHEEMCAKLDFVAALVKYSSPYSVSVKNLRDKFTWEAFTAFVMRDKKTYPHFVSYFLKG